MTKCSVHNELQKKELHTPFTPVLLVYYNYSISLVSVSSQSRIFKV